MPVSNAPMVTPPFPCIGLTDCRLGLGLLFTFSWMSLDSTVKKLGEEGIKFEELPNEKDWQWREARLKDPDGNQLILYHAGENRKNPPWRL